MIRILFVDDDPLYITQYATRFAGSPRLEYRILGTMSDALDMIRRDAIDVLVSDLVMPATEIDTPPEFRGGAEGLYLAAELKRLNPDAKTILMTGSFAQDPKQLGSYDFIDAAFRKVDLTPAKLERVTRALLGLEEVKLKSFIVHGHDHHLLLALKDFIQNTLHWAEPVILAQKPSMGLATVIEKFENYSADVDAVFVLATPDDIAGADPNKKRARQNVIFELGYFVGRLGRKAPIFLLTSSGVELPSDLGGVIYISIDGGIRAASEEIRTELAGFGLA